MLPAARLSLYRLEGSAIRQFEAHIVRLSNELADHMPPSTRAALAQCMGGVNSYYSNLIEGKLTRPVAAERTLRCGQQNLVCEERDAHALLAVAHISTERWMRAALRAEPAMDLASSDFICHLHGRLFGLLPKPQRVVHDTDDSRVAVNAPGDFRAVRVKVGAHVAPASAEISGLLSAFSESWRLLPKTPAHILLAHHRLAWVHPFLDGNGRVARLVTTAMLAQHDFDAGGLWSLSRGLAKHVDRYHEQLSLADAERAGDHDGRGLLSLKAATDFAEFMLDICEGEIRFMTEKLQRDCIKDGVVRLCAHRKLLLGRDERAVPLLIEAIYKGQVTNVEAWAVLGMSEREASTVIRECVDDGLLKRPAERADLASAFPVYAAAYLFPGLFEFDDPTTAMREALL